MEENTENKLDELIKYLYIMSGMINPSKRNNEMINEAIMYANIDLYVLKPLTLEDYRNKRIVEIKALSYLMCRKNQGDFEAVRYFREYEHREIAQLNFNTNPK